MKYRTAQNFLQLLRFSLFFGACLAAISLVIAPMTANANDLDTDFWYSDTRWALAVILELDDQGQEAAEKIIAEINPGLLSVVDIDDSSRAIIVFRNRSNVRYLDPANLLIGGEDYGPSLMLSVHDGESPNCVSILNFNNQVTDFGGKTEVKIGFVNPTYVKFKRNVTVRMLPLMQVGDIEVKGEWIRSVPETTPPNGDPAYFGGNQYLRSFLLNPETLRLLKNRRTVYSIIEGGLPTNPTNKIHLDVNFTDPDWQAVFGGPIVEALEYFGELILETILSETVCE